MKLHLIWTQHIRDAEAKETLAKTIFGSHVALNRLREILEQELESLLKPTEADYDSPSWSHLQAHRNGRIQQINSILTLLEPIKR